MARNLMSDAEWAFFEPFIVAVRHPNGRKPVDHRRVLDGIFWIARTGAPWRDLPDEFGKWGSVYRQFRRWTLAGLWETILGVLLDKLAQEIPVRPKLAPAWRPAALAWCKALAPAHSGSQANARRCRDQKAPRCCAAAEAVLN